MKLKFRFSHLCRRFRNLKRTFKLSEDFKKILCKLCKEEFRAKHAALRHETPEVFTLCHWQKKPGVHPAWVAYRFFITLYFLGSFLYTILPLDREVTKEQSRKYFIFLTNWTYVVETFQFVLAFIIVVIKKHKETKNKEPMSSLPWYYKLYWVLNTIVIPSAITVSLMFWATVYDPVLFPANAVNLIAHAFNSVFVIVDFILFAHPIKIMHFYWPLIYGFIYCSFSLIYELSGGTGVKGMVPIYKVLDWKNGPGRAILSCLTAIVILTIFHFLFSLFSVLKTFTKNKQKESTQV